MKKIGSKIWAASLWFVVVGFCASAWALPYYQLRDVSGERDGHTIAGPQWFATVFEGRYISTAWTRYLDTHGGEAPGVTMVTSADLIYDFSSVYLDDPQHNTSMGDDASFDPIQSVCLVIKEGQGSLRLDFGNDFARHASAPYSGPQDAMEDVLLSVTDYATRVEPPSPRLVASGDSLPASLFFQAESPQTYGSSLGYLTFRQSTSFDTDFKGYRESIKIPAVVANVYDGSAADPGNELRFDMTISNGGEIVTRKKFTWGADRDMTHDLGNFFIIQNPGIPLPQYRLTTRITNRTGTRYRNQRYDSLSQDYRDIPPSYWAYDLTPDLYGSLPSSFDLDPQSQIAPGLVTVFVNSMDMAYPTAESFRLYPYRGSDAPRDLRLTYRRIRGMTPYGTVSSSAGSPAPWSVTGFSMVFADALPDSDNTANEIAGYAGGKPVMPESYALTGIMDQYINADAFNSFTISADVPSGLTGSDDVAVLPLQVRLRVSRREIPLVDKWDEIANADNVAEAFANVCAVQVRSPNASELDMNLFSALRNRGYSVGQCVQAFTEGNYLNLEFIVLLADAASQNSGKTAFLQVVKDDRVPYILIGDGNPDNKWNLGFYVTRRSVSAAPDPEPAAPGPDYLSGGGGCSLNGGAMLAFSAFLGLAAVCSLAAGARGGRPGRERQE
jgi:hypothetical protein